MFKYLIIFVIGAFYSSTSAQEVVNASKLTLDRILTDSDFRTERFGPHQWLSGGAFYTTIETSEDGNTELILYHSESGERRVLIPDQELIDSNTGQQVQIEDYSWSADEKSLLIFTNSRRVWRTNSRGDYYLFHLDSRIFRKIGQGLPPSSLMFAKFGPKGDQVAYVSQQNLYVENISDGKRRQLTHDGTVDIINGTFDWAYEEEFFCRDGFRWSPDGQTIAYWQIDASETKDFYLINNTDGPYSQVIPIQYPKVGEKPSSARIGVVDVEKAVTHWLDIPGDAYQHYIPRVQWLKPTDKLLITQLSRKQNHLLLWLYDDSDQSLKKIYEEASNTWIDIVHIDASAAWEMEDQIILDQKGSFVWVSEKDGWRHLYRISVEDGSEVLLTPGDFDVASVKGFDPDANLLYFIASPEDATQRFLYSVDLSTKAIRRVTPDAKEGLNFYAVSPNGKYAVYRHENTNEPASAYLISLPEHEVTDVLYTNEAYRSALQALDLPAVEFFKVVTEDGVEMDGKIIKPKDFDPAIQYPVLFEVYGEPAGQTALHSMDDLWHLFLSQQGFLVITMDNRGTPSLKGRDWRKSIYRNLGVVNVRDQAMATTELLKKWKFMDPERIAVWGWSGGGAMTLNLLFQYPDIYQTGIAVAAVTNQLFYDNIYQERYMGLPVENEEDFIKGSPASHAAGLKGNLLYIHGTGDDNVHYQNAEYLFNALIAENKKFDIMIYPNRSHGIYEGQNTRRHLYSTMTDYLFKHLKR